MAKGKDFYGKDITDVIDQACKEFEVSQEELDIEVLETGSAGIFGLCKKKAHVRVKIKSEQKEAVPVDKKTVPSARSEGRSNQVEAATEKKKAKPKKERSQGQESEKVSDAPAPKDSIDDTEPVAKKEEIAFELPSQEVLDSIRDDLGRFLELMGFPSEIAVKVEGNTVQCNITGEYEDDITGSDGRTLDSLQYLMRKMMSRQLPDRVMIALNAGDFRERRAEELKLRAVELATLVKEDGKTQAIPALNPSERRVVHMILQEDKGVRSRSVGEGLFKKVLIYKPGKGRRSHSRKRRGNQSGRSSND